MSNQLKSATKWVSLAKLAWGAANHKAVSTGILEYSRGEAPDFDRFTDARAARHYENGRQLGAVLCAAGIHLHTIPAKRRADAILAFWQTHGTIGRNVGVSQYLVGNEPGAETPRPRAAAGMI